ncbi:hypothetical protein IAR50_003189 [Cryptococcus sp. DSM 104548]
MKALSHPVKRDSSSELAFFLPASSPIFKYSSSNSTSSSSSSNPTNPWTATYALQTDGYDETLHLTSSSHATIEFNITSTSLTLLVPPIASCTATVSLNASTPISACATKSSSSQIPWSIFGLEYGTHTVKWDSGKVGDGEQVIFWGVRGTRPGVGGGGKNVTIDNTFSSSSCSSCSSWPSAEASQRAVSITYSSGWTHLSNARGSNNTSTSDSGLSEKVDGLEGDFNGTLSVSQTEGDWVSFAGAGDAIYVYGTVGPDYGLARVELDGKVVVDSMNLTSPWSMHYQLLYVHTDLDPSTSTNVTLTNLGASSGSGGGEKMSLDFVVLTADDDVSIHLTSASSSFSSSSSKWTSTLSGKFVLFMLLPFLVVLLFSGVVWYILRRRRQLERAGRLSSFRSQPRAGGWVLPWLGGKNRAAREMGGSHRPWRDSRDSSSTSINHPSGGGRKKRKYWLFPGSSSASDNGNGASGGVGGRGSPTDSMEDVFVSYDEAKLQRMSGKWSSSSGCGAGSGSGRSPRTGMPGGRFTPGLAGAGWGLGTVRDGEGEGEDKSVRSARSAWSDRSKSSSPSKSERDRNDDSMGGGGEAIISVLDQNYAGYTTPRSPGHARRDTDLPAYTPSNDSFLHSHSRPLTNNTYASTPVAGSHHTNPQALNKSLPAMLPSSGSGTAGSPERGFASAEEDKPAQSRVMRDVAGEQGYLPPRLDLALPGPTEPGPCSATYTHPPPLPHPTHSHPRPAHAQHTHQPSRSSATTIGASDIISIFGAPAASERRMSMMTDHTGHSQFYSRPGSVVGDGEEVPPLPTSSSYPGWGLGMGIGLGSAGAPLAARGGGGGGGVGPVRPRIDTDLEKNPYGLPYMSHGRDASGGLSAMGLGLNSSMARTSSWYDSSALSGISNPWSRSLTLQTSQSSFIPPNIPSTPPTSYSIPQPHARPSTAPSHTLPMTTSVTTPNSAEHQRSQSTFSHMTERSAARPDSEVIPFESFMSSLNAAAAATRSTSDEEGKKRGV